MPSYLGHHRCRRPLAIFPTLMPATFYLIMRLLPTPSYGRNMNSVSMSIEGHWNISEWILALRRYGHCLPGRRLGWHNEYQHRNSAASSSIQNCTSRISLAPNAWCCEARMLADAVGAFAYADSICGPAAKGAAAVWYPCLVPMKTPRAHADSGRPASPRGQRVCAETPPPRTTRCAETPSYAAPRPTRTRLVEKAAEGELRDEAARDRAVARQRLHDARPAVHTPAARRAGAAGAACG